MTDDILTYCNCPSDCSVDFDSIFCTPIFRCGSWKEVWFINVLFLGLLVAIVWIEIKRRKVGRL